MLDSLKRQVKGSLRRAKDAFLPSREVREYERRIRARIEARKEIYTSEPEAGLFSILTAVWDGSPLEYLRALAERIAKQNAGDASEWVLLDNGCKRAELRSYLDELARLPWIRLVRAEKNLGILRGLRHCLEEARGRYVLPVDGDDLIDGDALRVVASSLQKRGYPALLYTDEDKVIGQRRYQPYLKPDWDPVLLLNSAYIAHLGVIDRAKALSLGAYNDRAAEGSPDWDLFVRFLIAGYEAVHLPEVVYSWRVHASSTADDDASKEYIANSQRVVLQRFLDSRAEGRLFELEQSRLFAGGVHWHFRRKPVGEARIGVVRGGDLTKWRAAATTSEFVALVGSDVEPAAEDWVWEARGIFELHADAAIVTGRICNERGELLEAGLDLDEHGTVLNPQSGKLIGDPGYFGQLWKQRSVGTASARLAVLRSDVLIEILNGLASPKDFANRAGTLVAQRNARVVYSPFIEGLCRSDSGSIS